MKFAYYGTLRKSQVDHLKWFGDFGGVPFEVWGTSELLDYPSRGYLNSAVLFKHMQDKTLVYPVPVAAYSDAMIGAKISSYLESNRPVIIAGEKISPEIREMIKAYRIGFCCQSAEDVRDIIKALTEF